MRDVINKKAHQRLLPAGATGATGADRFFKHILEFLDPGPLLEYLHFKEKGQAGFPIANAELPAPSKLSCVHDTEILRELLPKELYASIRSERILGYHALAFALRHRVCQLNALFHLQSLPDDSLASFAPVFGRYFNPQQVVREVSEALPVFGFSPSGIHSTVRTRGACRAFDAYDLQHCSLPATPLFCEKHVHEAWWAGTQGTTQAKMYAFYADRSHFHEFDEAALQRLMGRFFQALREWQDADLHPALVLFGLSGPDELAKLGMAELRQRYAAMAQKAHPDQGGTSENFQKLKEAYDLLRQAGGTGGR